MYLYGSHDVRLTEYCGRDQVVWSAPADDLSNWRFDGVIFRSLADAEGRPLSKDGLGDILFAPDVAVTTDANGTKTYWLYPNNQSAGRHSMVAKSSRPDGPFTVCNWSAADSTRTEGVMGFDPAVFVDDDGRVYGYCVFSIFAFHVIINVGMVLGLMPVIGIPLPFFSYGGSSLWGFTFLLFIFLRIDAGRIRMQR